MRLDHDASDEMIMRSINCPGAIRLFGEGGGCAIIFICALMVLSRQARAETDNEVASVSAASAVRQLTQELIKTRKSLEDVSANLNALSASLPQVVDLLKSIKEITGKISSTQDLMASDQAKKGNVVVISGVNHQEKTELNLCSIVLKNEVWKTLGVIDFAPATDQHLDPSTGALTQKKAGYVAQLICSN